MRPHAVATIFALFTVALLLRPLASPAAGAVMEVGMRDVLLFPDDDVGAAVATLSGNVVPDTPTA